MWVLVITIYSSLGNAITNVPGFENRNSCIHASVFAKQHKPQYGWTDAYCVYLGKR